MSISPRSGARGPQRLICLKYHNVLKRDIRFTFGWLNLAKSTHYIKKCFKWKLLVSLMKNIENVDAKLVFSLKSRIISIMILLSSSITSYVKYDKISLCKALPIFYLLAYCVMLWSFSKNHDSPPHTSSSRKLSSSTHCPGTTQQGLSEIIKRTKALYSSMP